ncbi:prolyl oligopeptidase family serine peptidase [Nonomuraea sp. KM88]|uniref:prolyl oligopeptidase family serine peptidase n=1 Tax=Nonomuraea sp. KM88 TaxID=3457427 RepID=UPI003FCD7CF0
MTRTTLKSARRHAVPASDVTPGERVLEAILAQRRVRVAHRCGRHILVEADVPRPGRPVPVPFVLNYLIDAGGNWELARADGHAAAVCVLDDETYLHLGAAPQATGGHAIWQVRGDVSSLVLETRRGIVSFAAGGPFAVAALWTGPGARSLTADDEAADAWRASGESAAFPTGDVWPLLGHRVDGSVLRLARVRLDGHGGAPAACLLDIPLPADTELTGQVAVTPDGRRCAAGVVRFAADGHRRFGLYVFPVAEPGTGRHVWVDDTDLTVPVASPDGAWFACTGELVSTPRSAPHQYVVFVAGDGERIETADHDDWLVPHAWHGDGTVLCLGEHDGRRLLRRVGLDGDVSPALEVPGSVSAVTVTEGEALVVSSAISRPPEVVPLPLDGRPASVAGYAPATLDCLEGRISRRVFSAADGSSWSSWLCLPPDDSAGPYPMLVWCHGGPVVSWTDWSWRWNPWPFVAEGYAVLMIDPPLSAGYGRDAVSRGWGRWLTEVARVAAEQVRGVVGADPMLDGTRLAVMGASLGGWLSIALATIMPEVRLVASHAGWVDLAAVARTCDLHWHWLREYGPVDGPAYARETARLSDLAKSVRVLLSHGVQDGHVPVYEALGIHRTLRAGGVDVRLMIMPDEGHTIRRPANAAAWFRWVRDSCAETLKGPR